MTVATSYSAKMKRLFLNVGFTPTAAFFKKTAGLCGFMDDDVTNDLTGPDGTVYNDIVAFVESCEYSVYYCNKNQILYSGCCLLRVLFSLSCLATNYSCAVDHVNGCYQTT